LCGRRRRKCWSREWFSWLGFHWERENGVIVKSGKGILGLSC